MKNNNSKNDWQLPSTSRGIVKDEPMESDSGIASGSDFNSSPGSDTNEHQPNIATNFLPNGYHLNPLTPPNSEPMVSPKSEASSSSHNSDDHIRRLMSLEKNLLKNDSMDELSNEGLGDRRKAPKNNYHHGKAKTFKCKQCDFVGRSKIEQWRHTKVHIRKDKRLSCTRCPFITEYKHHLEYHLRNHDGSKPFQCEECEYSCVNKSMLNSHMKSHSNIYRFRCRTCNYATKYCHSLKLHLRRYGHLPSVVLDEQGNPTPEVLIDVYGTRRGPKVKGASKKVAPEPIKQPEPQPPPPPPKQLPFYQFFGPFATPQLLQQLIQEQQALAALQNDTVLDLSKPGPSRRKGPAFRVDVNSMNCEDSDDEDDEDDCSTTVFNNVEAVVEETEKIDGEASNEESNNNKGEDSNKCQYCNITFGDEVLYTIHMGYHGFHHPFTCNMCGVPCSNSVNFFLHIARVSHA